MCRPYGPELQATPYAFDSVRSIAFPHAHALGRFQQLQNPAAHVVLRREATLTAVNMFGAFIMQVLVLVWA
jgi:hypothetical protein